MRFTINFTIKPDFKFNDLILKSFKDRDSTESIKEYKEFLHLTYGYEEENLHETFLGMNWFPYKAILTLIESAAKATEYKDITGLVLYPRGVNDNAGLLESLGLFLFNSGMFKAVYERDGWGSGINILYENFEIIKEKPSIEFYQEIMSLLIVKPNIPDTFERILPPIEQHAEKFNSILNSVKYELRQQAKNQESINGISILLNGVSELITDEIVAWLQLSGFNTAIKAPREASLGDQYWSINF